MAISRWITKDRRRISIKQKVKAKVNGSLQNRARKILNKQDELKKKRKPLENKKVRLVNEGLRIMEKAPNGDVLRLSPTQQKRLIDIKAEVDSLNYRLSRIK